jgi:murein DD-endopeptidase MepM/ murein hydrolase activator NlpD
VDATDGGIAYTYPGNYGYGNHIIIIHANGYASLYGHLSGFAVSSGTAVAKGQKIGFEGSTGFSSGPHLHFEIRLNDAPQDPCRYVVC